jgi:hypothetical protein
LYEKLHRWLSASSSVVQEIVRNTNDVSGVGVFEDATCFEQVNVVSFTYLKDSVNQIVLLHLQTSS